MNHVITAREIRIQKIPYYHVRCSCGELRFATLLRFENGRGEVLGITRAQAKVRADIEIRNHRKKVKYDA